MKQLRKVVFWMHLVTAVSAALVILLMSVTGVLLTYQRQITAWADTRGLDAGPPAPGAARLAPDALLARVAQTHPGKPTTLKWFADADAPAQVAFGREKTLFVSAYTGQVLSEGSTGVRAFFRKVVALHRWVGAEGENRELGKRISGAANLAFLFLVVSGFYLWFPRNWTRRAFRNVAWFRRGLAPKARDFNWHHVIGIWSLVPLFVIVVSGVVISYPWASNLVYRAVGETPPPPQGEARPAGGPAAGGPATASRPEGARGERGGASAASPSAGERGGSREGGERGGEAEQAVSLDGIGVLAVRAERQVEGWRSITLTLPKKADEPIAFAIDRGDGGQPQKRAQLALNPATGEVSKWEPFPTQTPGRRLRSILRFAHTGEVLGIPGQTLAGLVSLGAAFLVWTGLALTWRRYRQWRAPKRTATPSRRPEPLEETEAVAV
ncbi:MAG TPA: PepSY-associated TM helix domain-containing protein [Longimicrobium sp.]|nr:PepSY-associated TM helix domain-containing protein [Longimicrobium sp.]